MKRLRLLLLAACSACSSGSHTPQPPHTPTPDAATGPSLAEQGAKLFAARCDGCHSIDGSKKIGRSMKGVFGSDVTLSDGRTLKVDAAYLKDSIQNPKGYELPGYTEPMPAFAGLLSDKELDALAAYIETLK